MATVENCSLADRMDRVYEKRGIVYALRIIPSNSDITANTISIWIKPPAPHANTPNNQPMISITAMM
jgi:hypothetical protein